MLKRNEDVDIQVGPYDLATDCLPDLSCPLLRTSLADLERSLLNPAYVFKFDVYHRPQYQAAKCGICVAGGIIAQSEKIGPDCWWMGIDSSACRITYYKLRAVSEFSYGDVATGLAFMGLACGKSGNRNTYLTTWPDRNHNTANLSVLIPQIELLADDLEAAGL